ncbi:hypothetical protein EBZ97_03010 [bacterium]|nr:hypothetical protein [bacterium]
MCSVKDEKKGRSRRAWVLVLKQKSPLGMSRRAFRKRVRPGLKLLELALDLKLLCWVMSVRSGKVEKRLGVFGGKGKTLKNDINSINGRFVGLEQWICPFGGPSIDNLWDCWLGRLC